MNTNCYIATLRYLFLQTHAISYSSYSLLLYMGKEKEEKPDRKPYPLPYPYGLRNPSRNLKSENSQNYAQKPQRKCTFMGSLLYFSVLPMC
jgi:hypothetical protein